MLIVNSFIPYYTVTLFTFPNKIKYKDQKYSTDKFHNIPSLQPFDKCRQYENGIRYFNEVSIRQTEVLACHLLTY